jgi:hypothetical protein
VIGETIDILVAHRVGCYTALLLGEEAAAVYCCCIAEDGSLAVLGLDEAVRCWYCMAVVYCPVLVASLAAEVYCYCCTVEEGDLVVPGLEDWQMSRR